MIKQGGQSHPHSCSICPVHGCEWNPWIKHFFMFSYSHLNMEGIPLRDDQSLSWVLLINDLYVTQRIQHTCMIIVSYIIIFLFYIVTSTFFPKREPSGSSIKCSKLLIACWELHPAYKMIYLQLTWSLTLSAEKLRLDLSFNFHDSGFLYMGLLIEPNDEGIMLRKLMTWTAFEMTT